MIATVRRFIVGRLGLGGAEDRLIDEEQKRRRRHGQGHGERQEIGHVLADDLLRDAGGEQHEGELAALTDHEPEAPCRLALQPPPAAKRIEDDGLDGDETDDDGDELQRLRHQHAQIDRHSDGDEEYGEQQPLERTDIGFDLMAIFGIGEQCAGDERAEGRAETRGFHDQRHSDHRQQRARRHGLAHAGCGNDAIEPAENEAADDNHPDDGEDGEYAGAEVHGRLVRCADREQRHQCNERDGGEVLEQQDRESEAPMARIDLALLIQQLQREGRRGERECKPDEQRLGEGEAERKASGGEHKRGRHELGRAEPEDRRAHGP
jgi:hypothetical protein